jgi:CBS domain containing-hemolysin-like protein
LNPDILPALAGLLLVLSFAASLAGYSLRNFSFSRLDEICTRAGRADRFGRILRHYEQTLIAAELLSAVLMLAFFAAVLAWTDFGRPFPADGFEWIVFAGKMLVALLAWLAVVVILPWTISRVAGERFLFRAWPLLDGLALALRPIVGAATGIDHLMHRLSGRPEPDEDEAAAALNEEIRSVVDEGQREGLIEREAHSMIHRVMELQELDVAAIMTPRTDMVVIQADASLDEARQRLLKAGHSRIPVIGESADDIIGMLYAKDLLTHLDNGNGRQVGLREIVREPLYVPETTGIDALLEQMKREHIHIAIVIDEYSGVAGLVTMEDILEEIVGEIVDEYDLAEEEEIHVVEPGVLDVEARVRIDDLNEEHDLELPDDEDFDTVGGFVYSQLGRVPKPRETFTWKNLRITVLTAGKRKIHKVRIEVDESLAATAGEER